MVVLGQRWAEEFMKAHPNIVIQVQGGGSGTGIAALVNGTIEICQASRAMKDVERAQVSAKAGTPPLEYSVARDGLSVYVNSANKLSELTMAQLKDIFTGKTTNWKEVARR
jgi:phosphate transport system substrate-binding protein